MSTQQSRFKHQALHIVETITATNCKTPIDNAGALITMKRNINPQRDTPQHTTSSPQSQRMQLLQLALTAMITHGLTWITLLVTV
jgi:hypothetical protein